MYLPKQPHKTPKHKNRSTPGIKLPRASLLGPHPLLIAGQGGFWSASLVAHVFVKLKKLSKFPSTYARF